MLLTFATKNYAHWLDLLLRTWRWSNAEKEAKVYLIMNEGDFRQYTSDKFIEYHWIPSHQSLNMEESNNKVRSILRIKTSLILWELLLNPDEKIIWIDADSIVFKDIQPLMDKLDEYEFLATIRPWKKFDQQKLSAGVMGIRSTKKTIELFTKASRDVWSHWEGWWSEQLHIYRNLTPDIKHYSFTEEEHSLNNTKGAIIMSHHANKFSDMERYCEEIEAGESPIIR